MSFCSHCGSPLKPQAQFCLKCGHPVSGAQGAAPNGAGNTQNNSFQKAVDDLRDTPDRTAEFDSADIAANKVYAIFSYFSWLVLVPLLGASKSKFARFHANQGLMLVIAETVWQIASAMIRAVLRVLLRSFIFTSIIYGVLSAVLGLVNLLFLVWAILGIVNVANGRAKELPLIGKIKILKD